MSARPELPVTRATFAELPREQLTGPSLLKPVVWKVEVGDETYIVKDLTHVPRPCAWIARWLLRRERRSLERVADMPETPSVIGQLDRDALLLSYIPGRPLNGDDVRRSPRRLAQAIRELARRLHEHGVFHLDLHARGNLLIDEHGRLAVIDFGASVAPGAIARGLFGRALAWVDGQAPLKYLARYSPDALSEEEARKVLRQRRLRQLWPFNYGSRRVADGARRKLSGPAGRHESR